MKTIAEIQQAILELPRADYAQLSKWFLELDWKQWDSEIEQDSTTGKLDFLTEEATRAKADGTLRDL